MKPRTVLLIGLAVLVYFSLSLYHSHQLGKIPGAAGLTKGRSQPAGERKNSTWVQVSTLPENGNRTAEQTVEPNAEPREAIQIHAKKTMALVARQRITALEQALANREVRTADLQQQLKKDKEQIARQRAALRQAAQRSDIFSQNTGNSNSLITAQQAEIQQLEAALQAKTDGLATANARIKALAARLKHAGVNLATTERIIAPLQRSLVQAQARLANATMRLAVMQEETNQARLKAAAMLRYGQKQDRRLAPSRLEIDTLNTRLRRKQEILAAAEDEISALKNKQQQLHRQLATSQAESKKMKDVNNRLMVTSSALRRAEDRIKTLKDLNRETAGKKALGTAQKK